MTKVKAISFDLWDTVFVDDSDEPKRKSKGLPAKPEMRRQLVKNFLDRVQPISQELVNCAYHTVDIAFKKVWHEHLLTWNVSERLKILLGGLDRSLPKEDFLELVQLHEEMEILIKPNLVLGVANAIKELKKRFKLIVLSDAIFSPGWALRKILDNYDLLNYFDGFVFSDEVGHSKPHEKVFQKVIELANCSYAELIHLGDREHNDIAGPQAVGARAILITASINRGKELTKADAICDDFSQLEKIIDSLE